MSFSFIIVAHDVTVTVIGDEGSIRISRSLVDGRVVHIVVVVM